MSENTITKSPVGKFTKEQKQDKRVSRSKRDLADALQELLQEKNLDDITIQEIVDKAMVSKNTFYNNFLDKNELAAYLFSRYEKEIFLKCSPYINSGESFDVVMTNCIKVICHFFTERSEQFTKMVKNDKSKTIYWIFNHFAQEVVYEIFDHAKVFVLHPEISREMAALFYAGAFSNLIYFYYAKDLKINEQTFVEYMLILYKVNRNTNYIS